MNEEDLILEQQELERQKNIEFLRTSILSDRTLTPSGVAKRLAEVNNAFNEDTSEIDLREDIPDDIKEITRNLMINQKKQEQSALTNRYAQPKETAHSASALMAGNIREDFDNMTSEQKAQAISKNEEMKQIINNPEQNPFAQDIFYDGAFNNFFESAGALWEGTKRSGLGIISGGVGGSAKVSTSVQNSLASGKQQLELSADKQQINIYKDGLRKGKPNHTEEGLKKLEDAYNVRKESQINLIDNDPLLGELWNMGTNLYYSAKDWLGIGDGNERKAQIKTEADTSYLESEKNRLRQRAMAGDQSLLKADGTLDRETIDALAMINLKKLTTRVNSDGKIEDVPVGEVDNIEYAQYVNRANNRINKDRQSNYATPSNLNYANNVIGQVWEGTQDDMGQSYKELETSSAESLANNASNAVGKFLVNKDREGIKEFFNSATFGHYDGQLFQDLNSTFVTPFKHPIDSMANQIAEAPDWLDSLTGITTLASLSNQQAQTRLKIKELQDLGILDKNMSDGELSERYAKADLASFEGLLGDRLSRKVATDTIKAGASVTGLKNTKVGSFSQNTKAVAGHVASKIGSTHFNIAESELKEQAYSTSGQKAIKDQDRNQVIWDSTMPSMHELSPAISTARAGKNIAVNTVLKGTEFASDQWSKASSTYIASKSWIQNKNTNFKELRESIMSAELFNKNNTDNPTPPSTPRDRDEGTFFNPEDISKYEKNGSTKSDNTITNDRQSQGTQARVTPEAISIREKLFQQKENLLASINEVKSKFAGTRKDFIAREGKDDLQGDYYQEKKEANAFVTQSQLLADRATKAYNDMVTSTKKAYNDLVNSPEPTEEASKQKRNEEVEAMSDDILMNFQNLNMNEQEIESLAQSSAVQNNPKAKENFEFIKQLYNTQDVTVDEKSGLVAPMTPDTVPTNNQDRVTKEFYYGGGKQDWSKGIFNYVKDMRDTASKGDTNGVANLIRLATKWRNHQEDRIASGKLYGHILERAKQEADLIDRTIRYGERQIERSDKIKQMMQDQENNTVVTDQTVDNEINQVVQESVQQTETKIVRSELSKSIAELIDSQNVSEETKDKVKKILSSKEVPVEESIDTRSPTETITQDQIEANETINETIYQNIENDSAKATIAQPKGNTNVLASAKKVNEASKDARVSRIPKDFKPKEITPASITKMVLDSIDKFVNNPNAFLRFAEKDSASREALPQLLIEANQTRDSSDPRFQQLKAFAIDLDNQAKMFAPELAELTGKLVKQIDAIEQLQDLLADAKGKDASSIKGYINTMYKSTARTNTMINRFGGVKNIGLFAKYVIDQHFDDNREALIERTKVENAVPLQLQDAVNAKGSWFNVMSYAKQGVDKVIDFGKGVFTFGITKDGKIESNATNWHDGSEQSRQSFVADVVRRLRNNTKNMSPEREKAINESVGKLYDMIIDDLGRDSLKTNVEKNTKFVGRTNEYGMSPLNALSYALNGKNVLDDSIKASIIVGALQMVKEQLEDLTDRSPLSVAKLLGLESERELSYEEYEAFRNIGIPSNLLYSKLQTMFMSMFDTQGLDQSKTPEYLRERMATHAAVLAVNYLMDKGMLVKDKYSKDELNQAIENGVPFESDDLTFFSTINDVEYDQWNNRRTYVTDNIIETLSPWDQFYDLGYAVTGEENQSYGSDPVNINDRVRVIPQTDTYTKALHEGTLKHAKETVYSVVPYFGAIITDVEAMKELLGFNENLEDSIKQKELIESAKSGRENEIKTLEKNVAFLKKNPTYKDGFKHSMSIFSNGRTAIASTTLNPMSDKVSRAFLALNTYAKERTKAYMESNPEVEQMFLYGLAIRLGAKESSKQSRFDQAIEQINTMEIPQAVSDAVAKMRDNTATVEDLTLVRDFGLGFVQEKDNNLNVINAVYELVNYRALKDGSLDKYTSYATVDNDAKNSGVAITRAFFGELADDNINLDQVGIYIDGKFQSFAEYSQQDGNVDAYQFAIRKGIESAREKQNNPKGLDSGEIKQLDAQLKAFDRLGEALGVELLGQDGSVSGILRNIAKPLLMTAYYEARSNSLAKAARKEIMNVILNHMNKIIVNNDQEALDKFNGAFKTNFTMKSLANDRSNERMDSFLNNVEERVANPVAWMAVDGIMDLTSSTSEDRTNLTKANQSFFKNLSTLSNTIMGRLRAKNNGIATEAQRKDVDKFIRSGIMRLSTAIGDHNTNDFGLAIQETKKASISDLIGNELPNTKEFQGRTLESIERMQDGARKDELLAKIKEHNAKRSYAMLRQFQIKDGDMDNYAIPEVKTLGEIGVGSLALNAHSTDSAMINDIYMKGTESTLGVYDQVTTTPEGIIEASQIENQAFKEYTMNHSATGDFSSAMVSALHNIMENYENNDLIKELIPVAEFNQFIRKQQYQLAEMLKVNANVSERREQLFGKGKDIIIDNYPLGGIDNTVRSPSDNAPVTLGNEVKRFELAIKTLEKQKQLLTNNNQDGTFKRELSAVDKNINQTKNKLEVAKKAEINAQNIVKSSENVEISALQGWAKNNDSLIATEETLTTILGSLMKLDGNLDPALVSDYGTVLAQLISPLIQSNQELNPTRNQLAVKVDTTVRNQSAFGYFSPKSNEVVVSSSNLKGNQTNSEVFLHELVHGVLYHAINSSPELRTQMWEIFNGVKEQAISEGWDKQGHENFEIYDYVFNNPNNSGNTPTGLHEFGAYALTNPAFIELARNTQAKEMVQNFDLPVSTGGFFNKILTTVGNWIKELFIPKVSMNDSNAYDAMKGIMTNLDRTNREMIESIKLDKKGKIRSLRDAVSVVNKMSEKLADKTFTEVKNKVDSILNKAKTEPNATNSNNVNAFRTVMSLKNLSETDRINLINDIHLGRLAHDVINEAYSLNAKNNLVSSESTLGMAKSSLVGGYNKAGKVKDLILKSIMKRQQDSDLARSTIKERLSDFTKTITKDEDTAMNAGMLETSAYRLLDIVGSDALNKFIINHDNQRDIIIERARRDLQTNLPPEQVISILNQLDGMANDISGEGRRAPMQMKNVDNVIAGLYATEDRKSFFNDHSDMLNALKPQMEAYVAMKAYNQSSGYVKQSVESVFKKHQTNDGKMSDSLIDAIQTMQDVRNDSLHKEFGSNPTMMSAKYSSKMGDPNVMTHYVPAKEVKSFLKDGWKVVAKAKDMSDTAGQDIVMLEKRVPSDLGYNNHALQSSHQKNPHMTTVTMYQRLYGGDSEYISKNDIEKEYQAQAELAWNGSMDGNVLNMTPILNGSGVVTGFNHSSNIGRLPLSLQKDRQFSEVIADEYAQTAGNYTATEVSKDLISALKDDFDQNAHLAPNDFIQISNQRVLDNGSLNPFYNSYQRLTPEIKKEIFDTFGSNTIYVRKGMARAIVGSAKFDLANNPVVDYMNHYVAKNFTNKRDVALYNQAVGYAWNAIQPYLNVGDRAWRETVSLSKSAIAVMNPAVFAMNYMSNAVMLMVNGVTPIQLAKYTKESFTELRKYEANVKQLNKAQMQLDAYKGNPNGRRAIEAKINNIQNQIDSSLTKELTDKGMLQSIQTEIKYNEYGYYARGGNKIKEGLNNLNPNLALGDGVSTMFKEVFMVGDSRSATVMSYANQIMDYTSRYVYMKALTENGRKVHESRRPSRETLLREAQDLFINYALPDGKAVEAMNELGMVWFSKYYMGVQHVIMNMFKTRPVNSALYLYGINNIVSSENIYKNFFAVDAPSKLFRTPVDAVETLMVPPIIKAFF